MYFLAFFEIYIEICFTGHPEQLESLENYHSYFFICYLELIGRCYDFLFCAEVMLSCTIIDSTKMNSTFLFYPSL